MSERAGAAPLDTASAVERIAPGAAKSAMISYVNLQDLQAELDRMGVDSSRYSLRGGTPEDGFAIKREGSRWIVYYSERGGRYDIEKFDTQDAACRRLLQLLTTL